MRKIVSFMHLTVDGYAAGPDGEMDWIHVDDEIFDFAGDQTDHADTALYGRRTFEMMDAYWPTAADEPSARKHDIQHSDWYNKVEKIVLSHTKKDSTKNTRFISDRVVEEITALKQKPGKNILMFGSPGTVQSLVQLKLVDEFWLFINPIILGKGISYWPSLTNSTKLKLISSQTFSSGVVCVHYMRDE
ncbi:MAG TPA: dihydrofolate reductase family protein [Chitinophagaceae bacterium]|jgi:dihydrofolate reductase